MEYGCLPLDCSCYMLDKYWTGVYCKYFRDAVLPLNPTLEVALTDTGARAPMRICVICGEPFPQAGKQAYCSDACAASANRIKSRVRMARKRKRKVPGCDLSL